MIDKKHLRSGYSGGPSLGYRNTIMMKGRQTLQQLFDFFGEKISYTNEPPGEIGLKDIDILSDRQLNIIQDVDKDLRILLVAIQDYEDKEDKQDKATYRSPEIQMINNTPKWRIFLKQLARSRDKETLDEICTAAPSKRFLLNVSAEEPSAIRHISSYKERSPYEIYFANISMAIHKIALPFDVYIAGEIIDENLFAMVIYRKPPGGDLYRLPFELDKNRLLRMIDMLAEKNCSLSSLFLRDTIK